MIENYGLTETDLINVQNKIKNQKDYLTNNEFLTSNGQFKTLLDVSFSANHSERYYARLANKINTIENLSLNDYLVPIFLSPTLDGFYRDLLKGDYSRFKALRSDKREQALKSVPNDDRFGYIRFKMNNEEKLTIRDLYKILLFQNHNFTKTYAFKKLKKLGRNFHSVRTVEPHKDGVPHFHTLLFVPKELIENFKKGFESSFVAPRNKSKKAFITDVNDGSAYIMKYITKTFMDIKSNKELDYINAWFVKHKIMRVVTSRSTVPQWIYQIASIFEKDWYYLTDILKSPKNESEWSFEGDYFWIYDNWSDREISYFHGQLSVYSSGYLVNRTGKVAPKEKYNKYFYEKIPKNWQNKKEKVPIYQNNKIVQYYYNGKIYDNKKHISDMSLYELSNAYNTYDIDNDSYLKYLSLRNRMIDLGLLEEEKTDLNNFEIDKFLFDV